MEYGIVFSRNYAEPSDWLYGLFREYYQHFHATLAYPQTDNPAFRDVYRETVSGFMQYGLGFRMRMEKKTVMVWDFSSMKMALETVYAFLVSQEDAPLRLCKRCGEAFYATHGRSEFCSPRCRNQFHVYNSRGKQSG